MKYILGYFYRNSLDYLKMAIASVTPMREHIVVIDNTENASLRMEPGFPQDIEILVPSIPLTFTQSMNLLIRIGQERGCDVVMFMHNDVEAHAGTPERFLKTIEFLLEEGSRWGIASTYDYLSLFAQNMKMICEVGLWDTVWSDFYSDVDYLHRAHLAGYAFIDTELPITHHNGGGNTIKSDETLLHMTIINAPLWAEYYCAKWGGIIQQEIYQVPYQPESALAVPPFWRQGIRKFCV